jgi:CBS domain-containing protein
MRIKDIMSQRVVVCSEQGTLNDAARLMWEHDCGVVPIVKEDGRIGGIVTDRDICMAAYTKGRALGAIPITETMTRNVISCGADDSLEAAGQVMMDNQVRRLPVLDRDDRPVGIVSFSDLARHASTMVPRDAIDYEVIQGLAALSRPRLPSDRPAAHPPQVVGAAARPATTRRRH